MSKEHGLEVGKSYKLEVVGEPVEADYVVDRSVFDTEEAKVFVEAHFRKKGGRPKLPAHERKSSHISLRISKNLRERLEQKAYQSSKSLTAYITETLEKVSHS